MTRGIASLKKPFKRNQSLKKRSLTEGILYGGISTISSGLYPGMVIWRIRPMITQAKKRTP